MSGRPEKKIKCAKFKRVSQAPNWKISRSMETGLLVQLRSLKLKQRFLWFSEFLG